jgi:hypothetical protein
METKTVLIKTAPCEGNEKGEVRINEADFDAETMTLVGAEDAVTDSLVSLNKTELRELLTRTKSNMMPPRRKRTCWSWPRRTTSSRHNRSTLREKQT